MFEGKVDKIQHLIDTLRESWMQITELLPARPVTELERAFSMVIVR